MLNIHNIKINNSTVCWNDILKSKEKTDSSQIPASIAEEVTSFGKELTKEERAEMKEQFGDIKFDSISKFYSIPQNLVLPFNHNSVTIDFAAVEPAKPFLVKYQYILEGYDNIWSPITNKSTATFGNIYEGTYTFKLRAQSPFGIWSAPLTYTFKVLPPWYRTWWAYLLDIITIGLILLLIFRWRTTSLRRDKKILEQTVEERTAEVVAGKKMSDDLLLNILPEEVAEEFKKSGKAEAKQFDNVTVLFTDFVGFTTISEKLTPKELVAEIHFYFTAFDKIMERNGLEKIKTIGDAYLAICGLPHADKNHATKAVEAAIEIIEFMNNHEATGGKFNIRIGVNSGSVVAGIVGVKKFAYDIWGDTVNTAARMEQNSKNGKINISESTFQLVKNDFHCTHRGKIEAKNKGEIDMYFVERKI